MSQNDYYLHDLALSRLTKPRLRHMLADCIRTENYRPMHDRIAPIERFDSIADTVSVLERRVLEIESVGDIRWHKSDCDGVLIKR